MSHASGVVNRLSYNLLEIKLESQGTHPLSYNKNVYLSKFPPATHSTTVPNIDVPSSNIPPDHVTRETFANFWTSKDLRQANGDWKGGEWGTQNIPLLDDTWLTGLFVGDTITITLVAVGIIGFGVRKGAAFQQGDPVIEKSEHTAWSVNVQFGDRTYSGYLTESPMPQSAIDVLFIWKNKRGERFIKILKRGDPAPTVDMPKLFMPGAGEHKEPGADINFKAGVLRAVNEEIGIDSATVANSYLLRIGVFNAPKRDPRYWSYTTIQDGKEITFGIERASETNVFILYIDSDSNSRPKEAKALDQIEVKAKAWKTLNEILNYGGDHWMIPEHFSYVGLAVEALDRFDQFPKSEKEKHKHYLK